MQKSVLPEEPITRHITKRNKKGYYRPGDNSVRHNAFMPPRGKDEMSVFRILGICEGRAYALGRRYVVTNPTKYPLIGRVDIFAESIFKQGLKFDPNGKPHPRHANVINWPDKNSEPGETSQRRQIAVKLAAEATLHLLNP